jgi:predicted regulator of Ras-like GTPase activity (Roadblock/LC7/MglB family)
MNQSLLTILRSLRDIEGVLGSFIWLRDGRLLASDVPEACPPETLEAVAERVQRLCDALASTGDVFDSTTVAFAQYKLHVSLLDQAFIGTVLTSHVNMSALKMAVELARRQLSTVRLQVELQPMAADDRAPTPLDEDERNARRSYRGQRLPD